MSQKLLNGSEKMQLLDDDKMKIAALMEQKYSTYEWNIGRSPKGENSFAHKFDFGIVKIDFDTIDGKMQNVQISGDFFSKKDIFSLEQNLNGARFERKSLMDALNGVNEYIVGATNEEIVGAMFND